MLGATEAEPVQLRRRRDVRAMQEWWRDPALTAEGKRLLNDDASSITTRVPPQVGAQNVAAMVEPVLSSAQWSGDRGDLSRSKTWHRGTESPNGGVPIFAGNRMDGWKIQSRYGGYLARCRVHMIERDRGRHTSCGQNLSCFTRFGPGVS